MKKSVKILICELIPLVIATIILLVIGMGEHKVLSPDLSGWESRYTTLQDGKWTASPDMYPEEAQEEGQIDLIYGPFLSLSKGSYSVSIDYSCEYPQTFEAHSFENGDAVMVHEEESLDPAKETVTCHFTLKRPVNDMEIRVHYDGKGKVEIRNINVVSSTFLFREAVLFYAGLVFLTNAFLLLRDLYRRKSRLDGTYLAVQEIDRVKLVRKTVFATAIFFITAVIAYKQIALYSDYSLTYIWGRDVFYGYSHMSSYPMWILIDKYIYELGRILVGLPADYAAAITSGLVNAVTYLVIDWLISQKKVHYSDLIAFALMFVTAIYMPWYNPDIYMGQGSPNVWHSATILMIKPFTVLTFVLIVNLCEKIDKEEIVTRTDLALLTLILFLGVVAKPCLFQGIVPALGVYIIISLIRYKMRDYKTWLFIVLAFGPAFLLVVFQFVVTMFYEEKGAGIGFGWMDVIGYYAPNPYFSFLLVMFFPLMYIILNYKTAFKKTDIILMLLYVACSYLEYAILYENGVRKYHGNFGWAADLSYLIAFVVTAGHFFSDYQQENLTSKRDLIKSTVLLTAFLLHVGCGLYYVLQFFLDPGYKGFISR